MPSKTSIEWFKTTFESKIKTTIVGTPFDVDMINAIACQETGYIWATLQKKNLPVERITALCVGDTIDYQSPTKGRKAFPKNKAELLNHPKGEAMFDIARKALVGIAEHMQSYKDEAQNPNKFCRGFGVFQRDLQFFKVDPDYFLERKYEKFENTLAHCLGELRRGLKKLGYEGKTSLTDMEFAAVAIAYNTGGYNKSKGLQQGHFDGHKYYGEYIVEYLALSRSVPASRQITPGRYSVIARDGLKLRGGPGTNFDSERTLPAGTDLNVVSVAQEDSAWVLVDLEGDGLLDGYVFASFLAPSAPTEDAMEPD